MITKKSVLTMTTAAALCAAPLLAFGQQNTGGSSQMQGTTQTTPQQGTERGMPTARGAATTGSDTGQAPNTGGTAPSGSTAQGRTTNPSGNAMGESQQSTGGRAAAPGAPGATAQGNPGPSQGQMDRIRTNDGNTTGNDSRPGAASSTDGTPGNPPSTATQRAADSVTGNRTAPDGTGNNPPGTAAGRAIDRATDGNTGSNVTNAPVGGNTGTGTTNAPVGDRMGSAPANRTDATAGAAATGATAGTMAVDSSRMQGGRRASKVIGSTVYNENNESIGEVDDIIIPAGTTQPVAIISVGGFLGIGARLVAVPYERLQHSGDRDRWVLQGATKDSLQSLPAYEYEGGAAQRRG